MQRYLYTGIAALAVCGLTTQSRGHGSRLPDQDAAATARGEAFAATADNPAAIYYNPAGITQLEGHNARAGLYAISLSVDYTSPTGRTSDTKDEISPVPQLFYTYSPKNFPLAFGLGVYAPFGLGVEWPQGTGFRSLALKSEMSYVTVNPVVAWRIRPNLSIAAGPTINYSEIKLIQGVTPYVNNDQSVLKGHGTAYGFNLGVLWQPHEKISLGATYRSETEMSYDGNTRVGFVTPPPGYPPALKMDAEADLIFPPSVVAGISFRPTPKWNFEFDADWTDWDRVNTVHVRQAIPANLALNWQSSIYYEFGATRYFENGWRLSAGYIFNENSTPDRNFTPWVPDQDRHFISAGGGWHGSRFSFDVAYQFGFGPTRTVTGGLPSAMGETANGKYEYASHAVALSSGWHF